MLSEERLYAAIEEISSAAGHDLQDPLRLALAGDLDPQEAMRLVLERAKRLKEYSYILLDTEPFAEISLQELAESCLTLQKLKKLITHHSARIQISGLPRIWAKPRQMTWLFEEMVANAIIHNDTMPPEIGVTSTRKSDIYEVVFADNGPGIGEEYRRFVLGLFKKINPEIPGAGAGLALVFQILLNHGGSIKYEENSGLEGARWVVSLPLGAPPLAEFV